MRHGRTTATLIADSTTPPSSADTSDLLTSSLFTDTHINVRKC